MTNSGHIMIDPAILDGKPVIRGTRLSVEFIVQLLAQGWTEADIQANYDGVTHEQIAACLQYAADVLGSEKTVESCPISSAHAMIGSASSPSSKQIASECAIFRHERHQRWDAKVAMNPDREELS